MGSNISIVNETNCILNIALKQGTPLYYENKVLPGQTVKREVGKLLFTVEATIWNGLNDYKEIQITSEAIMGEIVSRTSLFKGIQDEVHDAICQLHSSNSRFVEDGHIKVGGVLLAVGSTPGTIRIVWDWLSCAVKEHAILMSSDKIIKICGGPTSVVINETDDTQFLDMEKFEPFAIVH